MHSFSSGSGSISALPPRVQKGLMGSLVMCAVGERKKEFLTQVMKGLIAVGERKEEVIKGLM